MKNNFEINGNTVKIYVNNKIGEFETLLDLNDYEKIKDYKINVRKCNNKFYAYTIIDKKHILMHRLITKCPKGMVVDHIGGSGTELDNRKSNLRICTIHENNMNHGVSKLNKSGVTGVYWNTHISTPKWVAHIKINRKRIHLGYFDNFDDAVKARIDAEDKYFGEFSKGNSIESFAEVDSN